MRPQRNGQKQNGLVESNDWRPRCYTSIQKIRPRIEEKDSIQKIMEEKSTWELRNTVPFFARRSTSFRRNGRRRFQRSGKLVRLHLVTHAEFPQIFQQLSCSRLRQLPYTEASAWVSQDVLECTTPFAYNHKIGVNTSAFTRVPI